MNNQVTNFMYYMYNKWSLDESIRVFGEDLGDHIYCKWLNRQDNLQWYGELDNNCKQKLVDVADKIYNK